MKTYRVMFKVDLKPAHPLFFKIQFGYLFVFLLAPSFEDAAHKAETILGCLPYETKSERVRVVLVIPEKQKNRHFLNCLNEVNQVGFSLFLMGLDIGAEDTPSDIFDDPEGSEKES
jgi:hypothetical protein